MLRRAAKMVSNVVIVTRSSARAGMLRRLMEFFPIRRRALVTSIEEAELEIHREKPKLLVVDISDYRSAEFRVKLEPFLLRLPGWIRTMIIDETPTKSRVTKIAQMGVDGLIRDPVSRHKMLNILSEEERDSGAQNQP